MRLKSFNFHKNHQSDHLSRTTTPEFHALTFVSIWIPHFNWPCMDLAIEKGVLTWLTAFPLDEYGFTLLMSAFQDALALHYVAGFPSYSYTVLVEHPHFSVEGTLSCNCLIKGVLPST